MRPENRLALTLPAAKVSIKVKQTSVDKIRYPLSVLFMGVSFLVTRNILCVISEAHPASLE